MSTTNWCEIYVDGNISCQALAEEVIAITNAKNAHSYNGRRWEVSTTVLSIDVERNQNQKYSSIWSRISAWWRNEKVADDEFLFYPLVISAEPNHESVYKEYKDLIAQIIQRIKCLGLRFALVADFEVE
ncbi:hypothetical protein [Gimesia fumaroli]|uniref:Uncharacterized protein n=1 Tax=Gimesia fumaroli TaxID=2527976 RepID=A0A518IE57_9PLAN|nr:hypothetical protein [Gimesia fumaroli]QDV51376.1 hypothetical protein Enr17x_34320 [Gimesia fumaroli]